MKKQNTWEKLFDEFMDLIEMGLVKTNEGYFHLRDYTGANLANIESEEFDNAQWLFERLDNYIYDYIATIKWSLDDIQDGWYNINVAIDLDEATFEVRVNDVVLDTISEKTHSWFLPHVSSNGTVFNSSYFIGRLGKKYGTTLNHIIKNAIYDPYICKDAKIAHT